MNYIEILGSFLFYYPIIMSLFWIIGGVFFYVRRERDCPAKPQLKAFPPVSILVPARNEQQDIQDTVEALFANDYPDFEVIVIDDASTDDTLKILQQLQAQYDKLRILSLKTNMGKAHALNHALPLTKSEIIFTIDADSMLDSQAIYWGVWHFENFVRVGAVTGNPRVRNRTSLLGKIQTAEYSSVIGLIKRTQRLLGKVMTVSGVIAAWRKQALVSAGGWSTDMLTDDIDMTWKLEKHFWDIRYETNMICWMLVPETLGGLWRQRKRWAQGGVEVLKKHWTVFKSIKNRRLWPVYIDYCLGVVWAYAFIISLVVFIIDFFWTLNLSIAILGSPFLYWNGSVIAVICLIQFLVSIILDSRYDKGLKSLYFWVIWYPVVYWLFNACTLLVAVPKGLMKKFGSTAVWISPDRGLRVVEQQEEKT